MAESDGRDNSDFWSALGGQLTVDTALFVEAGPPVDRYHLRTWRKVDEDETPPSVSERVFVGGRSSTNEGTQVVTRRGAGRVGPDGTFLVPAEPGDEVSIRSFDHMRARADPPTAHRAFEQNPFPAIPDLIQDTFLPDHLSVDDCPLWTVSTRSGICPAYPKSSSRTLRVRDETSSSAVD